MRVRLTRAARLRKERHAPRHRRRRPILSAGPVATAAPAAGVGAAHAARAASHSVVVYDCGTRAVSPPAAYTLACGDANARLTGLRGKGWGSAKATATGRLRLNTCTPTCVAGKMVSVPATVTVDRRANQAYRRMTVRLSGALPKGQARVETCRISASAEPALAG